MKTSVLLLPLLLTVMIVQVYGQEFTNYTVESTGGGLSSNLINSIAIDADGTKWIGIYGGLTSFDDKNWISYYNDSACKGDIWIIKINESGNLWIGAQWTEGDDTYGYYLEYFNGNECTIYIDTSWRWINDITIDTKGDLWYISRGHFFGAQLSKYDGETWTTYSIPFSHSLDCDQEGNIWIGTTDIGVLKFDGDTMWTSYTIEDGLVGNGVITIAIDSKDNKWFGTWSGVSRFDGTNWTNYNIEDGLADSIVYDIEVDDQDIVWFGTANGLSRFEGTSWTTYSTEDGLISNKINCLAVDNEGSIWIGTNEGLSKFTYNSTAIENNLFEQIKIYPNPTNSILTIETEQPELKSIEIHSLNGQLIYKGEMEGTTHQIDMSQFSRGVYFVTVKSKEFVRTEKIVKL